MEKETKIYSVAAFIFDSPLVGKSFWEDFRQLFEKHNIKGVGDKVYLEVMADKMNQSPLIDLARLMQVEDNKDYLNKSWEKHKGNL